MKECSIGIDLGTTYSSVAAFNRVSGVAEMIADERGRVVMPSVVSLDPNSRSVVVGQRAKHNLLINPGNTVTEIKREFGKSFQDAGHSDVLRSESEAWFLSSEPYRVRFADQWFTPQEISAFILRKLKETAEIHLGAEVDEAVIAVPAYFTRAAKEAVEEASLMAGFERCRLITEAMAAAVSYSNDHFEERSRHYAVFRIGGGSSDASVVRIAGNEVQELAIAGAADIGGVSFDNCIVNWAVSQLSAKYDIHVVPETPEWFEVKAEAERAKLSLTTAESAELLLARVSGNTPVTLGLDRGEFESLVAPLVARLIQLLADVLKSAPEVDRVLLVGGPTRMPVIQAKLSELLGRGAEFFETLSPDAAVARGAALSGADDALPAGAASSPDANADLSAARARLIEMLKPNAAGPPVDEFGRLPARPPRAFLCHASEDKAAVRALHARLRGNYVEPWLDEVDIIPGQQWRLAIAKAMRTADVVVVCMSRASVVKTGYVNKEIKDALEIRDLQPEGAIFLIPTRLDDCEVPSALQELHRVDLFESSGYAKLIRALRVRAGV